MKKIISIDTAIEAGVNVFGRNGLLVEETRNILSTGNTLLANGKSYKGFSVKSTDPNVCSCRCWIEEVELALQ
jgi:hypothetical protein